MAQPGGQQSAVARIYALALYRLAAERGEVEGLAAELAELAQLVATDEELASFLRTPLLDAETRRAAIEQIFRSRASDLLVDALQVINRKGRLALLPELERAFRATVAKEEGRVGVRVVTAVPLAAGLAERLRAAVARFTQRIPELEERVDPELIGGVVLRIDDQKIDRSVASELERLSASLLARASREILSGKHFVTE